MVEPIIASMVVIDDEELDQYLYRCVIDRSGLVQNVHSFYMAEDALEFLRDPNRDPIDVILLDIRMPGRDGFEFLEAATQEFGDDFTKLVVIMLTTSLDPSDKARADQFPVVKAFLNKPLDAERLTHIAELARSH